MEVNDLYHREGWVTFLFPDRSKKVIFTTFSDKILSSVYSKREHEGQLFDLRKQRWINIPREKDVQLLVSEDKPEMNEVDNFADQFI